MRSFATPVTRPAAIDADGALHFTSFLAVSSKLDCRGTSSLSFEVSPFSSIFSSSRRLRPEWFLICPLSIFISSPSPVPDEKIVFALATIVLDVRNHPLLIHCNKGKVRRLSRQDSSINADVLLFETPPSSIARDASLGVFENSSTGRCPPSLKNIDYSQRQKREVMINNLSKRSNKETRFVSFSFSPCCRFHNLTDLSSSFSSGLGQSRCTFCTIMGVRKGSRRNVKRYPH